MYSFDKLLTLPIRQKVARNLAKVADIPWKKVVRYVDMKKERVGHCKVQFKKLHSFFRCIYLSFKPFIFFLFRSLVKYILYSKKLTSIKYIFFLIITYLNS